MNQYLLCSLLLLTACQQGSEQKKDQSKGLLPKRVLQPAFKDILEKAGVNGAILIYDEQAQTYYSNDFEWSERGFIPASTFKIPNSLIALETGVIENDSTVILWDGQHRNIRQWNQNLSFRDAFHFSCVPCYQRMALEVGLERMRDYLKKFNYGEMDVDSTNLDTFWLLGNSKISQLEQIDFLQRFYHSQLPIGMRTERIAKRMMQVEKTATYRLLAKTGLSMDQSGWYVGYIEKEYSVYYFAAHMRPQGTFDPATRKQTLWAALQQLGVVD